MARRYQRVEAPELQDIGLQPSTSKEPIDWSVCALCQETSKEAVVCPARKGGNGYKYVAENIAEFEKLGSNPLPISFSRLNEGNGIEETFRKNSACWHKSCRTKISNLVLDRKRKKAESSCSSPVKTRRAVGTSSVSDDTQTSVSQRPSLCFFCDGPPGSVGLHEAWTLPLDYKVRCHAQDLNDSSLLRKLADRDMVASEAKYHLKCLTAFYRRKPKYVQEENEEDEASTLHAIAFAELVTYIESFRNDPETAPVFRMPNLCRLYGDRLKDLGLQVASRVHSGRLKEKLLAAVPDLFVSEQGREVVLLFNKDLGKAIEKACTRDSEVLELARAAEVVRKEIFKFKSTFNGRLQDECQEKSVPAALKALVAFILDGPAAIEPSDAADNSQRQAILTISQLLAFNCRRFSRKKSSFKRHNKERETPLPIYLSLKVHAETRKKELVDTMASLGMGISYSRVMTISSQTANSIILKFEDDGVVVPTSLMKNVFTVGVVDNLDHNPSSTTASDSFHGTGISLIQHREADGDGQEQPVPVFHSKQNCQGIPHLPDKYTTVLPTVVPPKEQMVPESPGPYKPHIESEVRQHQDEYGWLEKVKAYIENADSQDQQALSWASYHASQRPDAGNPTSIIRLLPLLYENAHSTALIKHVMDLVKAATEFLNADQTPVLAMDQPLYALAKPIQWHWPDTYGEKNFVIMMGGFHVEQAALRTIGDWLCGSGWVSALTAAGVASSGVAESFLRASHVTRTRHAHQVTAAALYVLLRQAYQKYMESNTESKVTFEEWKSEMAHSQPQFAYWTLVLDFELTVLQLVRSVRTSDFKLYIQCLSQLLPWFFALDHVNYARWLSVHVRDLTMLENTHANIFQQFWAGGFVARKTKRAFSAIALDQAHEQCNALVKGDGGAVGLTNNPSALRRWMVAGPEIARMVEEFEKQTFRGGPIDTGHHEQLPSFQATFSLQVNEMIAALEDMGNPFIEDSHYLFALDTKDIMSEETVNTVRGIVSLGQQQYNNFIEERFRKREKSITEPISRNKLALFCNQKPRSIRSTSLGVLKSDVALFARLYIACQTRGGNLREFFRHENQPWPPALAHLGELRSGSKADLVVSLTSQANRRPLPAACQPSQAPGGDRSAASRDLAEVPAEVLHDTADFMVEDPLDETSDVLNEAVPAPVPACSPEVDAKVLDGAAIVQMLSTKLAKTFQDYFELIFLPYILRQFETTSRVDIVWDVYSADSLKASARERRGCGSRRRVLPSAQLPGNWKGFLRDNDNKSEFFHFVATQLAEKTYGAGKKLVTTCCDKVLCSPMESLHNLEPCSHEEADTRVILHAADCATSGFRKVLIRTTDTDVLVLAIAHFHKIGAAEFWIAFGCGKRFRYIAAHEIADSLGPEKARALMAFHAFTGCDTVSFFAGRGKKTAWSTWTVFPDATNAFLAIVDRVVTEETITTLQRFIVLMYDRSSTLVTVDAARQALFSRNSKSLESIPPTEAALRQHIMRTTFQAGHVWGQSLIKCPLLPSPSTLGWQREENKPWRPIWSTLPQAQDSCQELIRCGCKQGCRGRCTCRKAGLPCTALCFCSGDCCRED